MRMSMTAFARADGEVGNLMFTVEVKSVNHRFLEVSPKLPDGLRSIETAIRSKFQEAMYRGKIDVWVAVKPQNGEKQLMLNPPLIKRWLLEFSDSGAMESLGKPDWQTILGLPGVMLEAATNQEELCEAVLETVDTAIAMLLDMRSREGEQIAAVLEEQLTTLETKLLEVKAHLPSVEQQLRENLMAKLADLKIEIDSQRYEQEVVLLLSRADIQEEIDRLFFHIKEARSTLQQKDAVGRRMDFLMQEFNREANTLGSKAADNFLSKAAVDLKVIIEQMREQIQNLE